jgi:hypothetical protein
LCRSRLRMQKRNRDQGEQDVHWFYHIVVYTTIALRQSSKFLYSNSLDFGVRSILLGSGAAGEFELQRVCSADPK